MKLNDPLSKYAPPGARVPDWQGKPITLVNLATHTSALPREQPGGAAHRPVFVWPTRQQRWNWLSTATLKAAPGSQAAYSTWPSIYWQTRSPPPPANRIRSCLKSRSPGRWG